MLSLQDNEEPPTKSWPSLLKAKEDSPEVSVELISTKLGMRITPHPHLTNTAMMVPSHFPSKVLEVPLCILNAGLLPISQLWKFRLE